MVGSGNAEQTGRTRLGPEELVRTATVARHHYLLGRSKVEIAEDLGISRFKVARMLDAAREAGLVQISIGQVDGLDLDASARLTDALRLRHCAVVASGAGADTEVLAALGGTAARLLADVLAPGDVLGLPWSRAVLAMAQRLDRLPAVRVVQLTGALEQPGHDATAVDIVRSAARASGGQSSIFHAPFALDDVEAAAALRADRTVATGLEQAGTVTHAAVGVGAWAPGMSTIYDVATAEERRRLAEAGVVGEIAGVPFDADGRPVQDPMTDRLITLSGDQLQGIGEVMALAYGAAKAGAVRAALRGGLVTSLVVDAALAARLEGDDGPAVTVPR